MAVLAMRFAHILGDSVAASTDVLFICDRLDMKRVEAGSDSTKMIADKFFGNRTDYVFVNKPMEPMRLTSKIKSPVTAAQCSGKYPAIAR